MTYTTPSIRIDGNDHQHRAEVLAEYIEKTTRQASFEQSGIHSTFSVILPDSQKTYFEFTAAERKDITRKAVELHKKTCDELTEERNTFAERMPLLFGIMTPKN